MEHSGWMSPRYEGFSHRSSACMKFVEGGTRRSGHYASGIMSQPVCGAEPGVAREASKKSADLAPKRGISLNAPYFINDKSLISHTKITP